MKKDERKVLTYDGIRQSLQESIGAFLCLIGLLFWAIFRSVGDGFQHEYRFIAVGMALLFSTPFFVVAVVLIVRPLIQWRMVQQGQYEILEDTLVNAFCHHNPRGVDRSDLYFENYGSFSRTGNYENPSIFGVTYILVVFKDQKGTLVSMYSTREYRLERGESA